MSLRTSATRYAKALFDVAIKESDPAQIERDLAAIVDAIQQHAELRRVIASPGTPYAARMNIVKALADRAQVQPPVAKLVTLLADRGRLELLPDLLLVYRERLLEHNNIVRATVTSATPLSPEKLQALAAKLGGLTGKSVQLETTVDPGIVGGVIARVGGTVYDGSIRTQLAKLRQQLVENA
jgi:F-type H+-transporting ATPase subunit delta